MPHRATITVEGESWVFRSPEEVALYVDTILRTAAGGTPPIVRVVRDQDGPLMHQDDEEPEP